MHMYGCGGRGAGGVDMFGYVGAHITCDSLNGMLAY